MNTVIKRRNVGDHKCPICKGNFNRDELVIDKDPKTSAVRGIICHDCDEALDNFNNDPELIRKAVAYLQSHGQV